MLFRLPGKKSDADSDQDLLAAFAATGSLDTLGRLYSRYMHMVYGVCLKYLGDRDEASDAVMSIFEKLTKELPGHDIVSFSGWLHVVTKNFCLMQLRSEKSKNEKLIEWMNDSAVFMEYEENLHPIDRDGQDLEANLAECIKRLKAEQRDCIDMFYFGNRSYSEIAGKLSIDEKKVKSHLQNAKRNLRICIEEKNAERE